MMPSFVSATLAPGSVIDTPSERDGFLPPRDRSIRKGSTAGGGSTSPAGTIGIGISREPSPVSPIIGRWAWAQTDGHPA